MDVRDLLFPPGATRHDWVIDGALAFALTLLTLWPYSLMYRPVEPAAFLAMALMVTPLVLRRHSPLLMLLLVTLGGLMLLVFWQYPTATLIAIPIVAYSVARWIPGPPARVVLVIGAVAAIIGPMTWLLDAFSLSRLVQFILASFVCMGLVVTPYAIGRRVRESTEAHLHRIAVAEERYRAMITEREQQTRLAESRARTQIARELHDIVAHSLSVMIVQAEGGRAAAAKKPEAAAEALTTIAETGREALTEMRRILGVLRAEPGPGQPVDYAPAPRLVDIPDLVQRTSDRIGLVVTGEPPRVSPAVELTAYRVVQEALTNVLKHAGAQATASVSLAYSPREITIEILDDGRGAAAVTPQPAGLGLRGMHERVTSMGGRLVTRPRPHGGFQVTAVLPVGGRVEPHLPSTDPLPARWPMEGT